MRAKKRVCQRTVQAWDGGESSQTKLSKGKPRSFSKLSRKGGQKLTLGKKKKKDGNLGGEVPKYRVMRTIALLKQSKGFPQSEERIKASRGLRHISFWRSRIRPGMCAEDTGARQCVAKTGFTMDWEELFSQKPPGDHGLLTCPWNNSWRKTRSRTNSSRFEKDEDWLSKREERYPVPAYRGKSGGGGRVPAFSCFQTSDSNKVLGRTGGNEEKSSKKKRPFRRKHNEETGGWGDLEVEGKTATSHRGAGGGRSLRDRGALEWEKRGTEKRKKRVTHSELIARRSKATREQ